MAVSGARPSDLDGQLDRWGDPVCRVPRWGPVGHHPRGRVGDRAVGDPARRRGHHRGHPRSSGGRHRWPDPDGRPALQLNHRPVHQPRPRTRRQRQRLRLSGLAQHMAWNIAGFGAGGALARFGSRGLRGATSALRRHVLSAPKWRIAVGRAAGEGTHAGRTAWSWTLAARNIARSTAYWAAFNGHGRFNRGFE